MASAKHWQQLVVLGACIIVGGFVSAVLLGVLGVSQQLDTARVSTYLISAIVTQLVMFVGAAFLYFKVTGIRWQSYILIGRTTKKQVFLAIGFFLFALLLTLAFSPIANVIETHFSDHPWVRYQAEISEVQNEVIGSLRGVKIVLALLILALLPGIAEEIIFRGILFKILKDLSGQNQMAMVLSAFIFAIFHFQIISFIPIMIVGYLLALLYQKSNNLLLCISLHFMFNAIQIIFW